ncbi:RNase adapter RapZ [Myxococcota bacterium]|nr:RNase adapter RapZ [Myxococcota bacterium]
MRLVIVTGLSGAGKTVALHALEDLGFFAVDNLPVPLMAGFAALLMSNPDYPVAAIAIDIRNADFLSHWQGVKAQLLRMNHTVEILFLEASDAAIVARYQASRRPHPLSDGDQLLPTIADERALLEELRKDVNWLVDTTDLTTHELRGRVFSFFSDFELPPLRVHLISFGFSKGLPMNADMVVDARFLPNPYFVQGLSDLLGTDPPVQAFLENHTEVRDFVDKLADLVLYLLPRYRSEGKAYFTLAVGCTGGRHRSVYVAEALQKRLTNAGFEPRVSHRDAQGT